MAAKLTLQINSLEALERLIGGDTEVELDIRRSVVDAFAGKHLKPIAEARLKELTDKLLESTRKAWDKELDTYFTSRYNGQLKEPYLSALANAVNTLVNSEARAMIDQAAVNAVNQINQRTQMWLLDLDGRFSQLTTESRFNQMVDQVAQQKVAAILAKLNQ